MRTCLVATTALLLVGCLTITITSAQPPLGNPNKLQRLPDDDVEGAVWEYRGTPKKKPKEGDEVAELKGQFRIEGTAIFDASPRIKLPSRGEARKVLDSIRKGQAPSLKAPTAPTPKRIGEYRKLSNSKRRLDFNDEESLNGIMIIWRKKNTADVWMGTYKQRQAGKTTREWQVELRPIQD
jgi:hypothetical protein